MNDEFEEFIKDGNEFSINTDLLAEWALGKIAEEKEETQRLSSVCESKIAEYEEKIQQYKKQFETKTSYFRGQLQQYFESVPHKATKTQESYKLPSGTLKLKFQNPEFKQDETIFLKWLKDNDKLDFIETKEKSKWGELKKVCTVSDGKVLTADGEIVEGVEVIEKPSIFEVEI
jgi:hypothetical protein